MSSHDKALAYPIMFFNGGVMKPVLVLLVLFFVESSLILEIDPPWKVHYKVTMAKR